MAFNFNRGFLYAVVVVMVATAELLGNAGAATYVVGDNLGWTVPSSPTTYATWASRYVFAVGDVLVFNFSTGLHDVAHVTKGAFDGCSSSNPIALATVGPANFTLNSTGPDYYICTFGSHCSLGQKLTINVTASSSTPPSTPAPAPLPPTTTPAPAPSGTPPPSSQSSPSPAPSSSATPPLSPGPSPSPTPTGSTTPPPSPAPGLSPEAPSPPFSPTGELIPPPPPPPSSAAIATINALFVMFASIIAIGLVMI